MSALLKPLIYQTNAAGVVSECVNAEQVATITTNDRLGDFPTKDGFTIVFTMVNAGGGRPQEVIWKYDDAVSRDADYVLVLAAIAVEMV